MNAAKFFMWIVLLIVMGWFFLWSWKFILGACIGAAVGLVYGYFKFSTPVEPIVVEVTKDFFNNEEAS